MNIPYSQDIERAVLVALLSDPMLLPRISEILQPSDFYKIEHQEIYHTICDLQGAADSLTVAEKLSDRAKEYFTALVADSERILPSISNSIIYAETVKGKAKLRAAIALGQGIEELAYRDNADPNEVLQQLEDNFANFIKQRVLEDSSESSVESYQKFIKGLSNRVDEDAQGITTGLTEVDLILHRLEGLVIVAARTSLGKTSYAINLARNVSRNVPVVFFSLEQTKEQIFERMLAREAQVPLEDIRSGSYLANPSMVADIEGANKSLEKVMETFHIDDRPNVPTSYVTSVARQKAYEWGKVGLIVVDYLHLMKLPTGNKVDTLGDACKELRSLGKELGCPVIVLSQLSRGPSNERGERTNKRPGMADLRASGEIEQSADIIMFLHRESYGEAFGGVEEDIAEVIVAKNRNGRLGLVEVKWTPRYMRFSDL